MVAQMERDLQPTTPMTWFVEGAWNSPWTSVPRRQAAVAWTRETFSSKPRKDDGNKRSKTNLIIIQSVINLLASGSL